jgi:hypothetical protein
MAGHRWGRALALERDDSQLKAVLIHTSNLCVPSCALGNLLEESCFEQKIQCSSSKTLTFGLHILMSKCFLRWSVCIFQMYMFLIHQQAISLLLYLKTSY